MYDKYLEFAKTLALQSGKIIKRNFALGMTKDWKSDNTPVTETDLAINRLVIEAVHNKFPGHSVIGEEESNKISGSLAWVCDPVDGTTAFSHGLPISTFSLALTENGKAIAGVVYDPYIDRMFYATRGGGAYLNDEPLHVTQKETLDSGLIEIAGIYSNKSVINLDNLHNNLFTVGALTTTLWSTILPTVLVAAGEFAATIFTESKCVDGAAASVIVTEAGGKFTDLFGNDQRYDQPIKGFVASNGLVHDQLLKIIAQTAKENENNRH